MVSKKSKEYNWRKEYRYKAADGFSQLVVLVLVLGTVLATCTTAGSPCTIRILSSSPPRLRLVRWSPSIFFLFMVVYGNNEERVWNSQQSELSVH